MGLILDPDQISRIIRVACQSAIFATGLLLISGPDGQADPVFTPAATETCVSQAQSKSKSLSGYTVLDCVGQAAQACMNSPGGDTTIGMIDCLQGELHYWDKQLNAAFATRVAAAKKQDAEIRRLKSSAHSLEESLRKMQRAWISYRDATCLYEQAQWQGGTGGGPATAECQMNETARQTLRLEGWWSQ